ncbi:hypothetical protein Bca4012_027525 [Brassica carinata]
MTTSAEQGNERRRVGRSQTTRRRVAGVHRRKWPGGATELGHCGQEFTVETWQVPEAVDADGREEEEDQTLSLTRSQT